MKVSLVRVTENPKMAMAEAGANCYDSIPREGIVDHCYESGHHSIMEFADFHFHIEGVSRALSHQLVRHRIASYAQRSQRYCEEDGFGYVVPPKVDPNKNYKIDVTDMPYSFNDSNIYLSYADFMTLTEKMYRALKQDVPAEDSRYVLPNACDTIIDVKMNFRALMNFMNERLCTRAQWEIRKLAQLMRLEIKDRFPDLIKFLVPKCEIHRPHCFCTEAKSCDRHPHISEVYKWYKIMEDRSENYPDVDIDLKPIKST